jgi:hypothetical protein
MENTDQQRQAFELFYSTLTEHEKLCMEKARQEKILSDLQIQVKKTEAEVSSITLVFNLHLRVNWIRLHGSAL